jgi:hypothetical protein
MASGLEKMQKLSMALSLTHKLNPHILPTTKGESISNLNIKGYLSTRMNDIATGANMGKGGIHRYLSMKNGGFL